MAITRRDEVFMEWLARQDPREWHRTASCWNWDSENNVLFWIIRRPCDRATALDVFWKSAPESALDESWSTVPGWHETNRLAGTILQNWKAGFYRESRFAYHFTSEWYSLAEGDKYDRLREMIPASMAKSIAGEELDTSDCMEGFSPQAVAYLESRGISI
jgi:hypothetical protein